MEPDRNLACWLVAHRRQIERALKLRLGPAAPADGSPESEALRRFRSFLASVLARGESLSPALDGLRLNERRVMALVEAWTQAAAETAREQSTHLAAHLAAHPAAHPAAHLAAKVGPVVETFRLSIRTTQGGRAQRGRPRSTRRVVVAAIDRIGDGFLAIDTDSGEIVDANPAAASLLGVDRDALLGVDALCFVERNGRDSWWTQLDAITESSDPRTFRTRLVDSSGGPLDVAATMTRFATRGRVLALLTVRPRPLSSTATTS